MAPVSLSICSTACSGDVIVGSEGPKTSASKIPTLAPIIRSVYARFTDVVDFPTPPLHEDTAMMCLTPLRPSTASGMSLVTGCAVMLTLHDLAHSNAVTNCLDRRSNSSLTGHAGVVSSRVNVTSPASDTRRSLTNPQLTMSSPKSGSMTLRRAFRTSASLLPSGADVMDGDDDDACARIETGPRRVEVVRRPAPAATVLRAILPPVPPTLRRAPRRESLGRIAARVAMASMVRTRRLRRVASRRRCDGEADDAPRCG